MMNDILERKCCPCQADGICAVTADRDRKLRHQITKKLEELALAENVRRTRVSLPFACTAADLTVSRIDFAHVL
jgi:hypothetical protein